MTDNFKLYFRMSQDCCHYAHDCNSRGLLTGNADESQMQK